MFTIQYQDATGISKMQTLDTKHLHRLLSHLAAFNLPIMAVYEGTTPITKRVRLQMQRMTGTLTKEARAFANSL